jgi:hypothetical protein
MDLDALDWQKWTKWNCILEWMRIALFRLVACCMEISQMMSFLTTAVPLRTQIILWYYFKRCGGLTSCILRRSTEIWMNTTRSVCRGPWNGNWVHTKAKRAKSGDQTIQSCHSLQSDSYTYKFTKIHWELSKKLLLSCCWLSRRSALP